MGGRTRDHDGRARWKTSGPRLLLSVVLSAGCSAGFKSSALVGAQGAALGEHARATETALLCDFGRALLPTAQASCAAWTKKTADRKIALRVLASYGQALKALSVLPKPDAAEAADGMLAALDALAELEGAPLEPRDKAAFKGALSGLVGFVSQAHRAKVITRVVRDADRPVTQLVETLTLQLDLREDYLLTLDAKLDAVLAASFESGSEARRVLREAAADEASALAPGSAVEQTAVCTGPSLVANNATDRLAFAEVRHHISILLKDNAHARRSLRAFGGAHKRLASESRRLKGEDAELARDLAIDLKAIYSAVSSEEIEP